MSRTKNPDAKLIALGKKFEAARRAILAVADIEDDHDDAWNAATDKADALASQICAMTPTTVEGFRVLALVAAYGVDGMTADDPVAAVASLDPDAAEDRCTRVLIMRLLRITEADVDCYTAEKDAEDAARRRAAAEAEAAAIAAIPGRLRGKRVDGIMLDGKVVPLAELQAMAPEAVTA